MAELSPDALSREPYSGSVAPAGARGPTAPVDAIRESERLYRAIGGSAPAIIWMDDAEGQCVYLNGAWTDFTGLTEADGLGEGWSKVVHPDDRTAFRAKFLQAIAVQQPFRSEYRMRRHDGAWRWVIDSATPIFDPDGGFQGHLGSVIDITERKQIEAALQDNEEKLRLAVEATELGLWDYDIASGALVWNGRLKELYGLSPDAEVTYEIYRQGIHPEERERIAAEYQAALDPTGTGRFGFEHRTVGRNDGVIRWVHAAGHVVFDARSRPVRVIGTVRDITERKLAEEALRASEARYRQVVEASLQGIWVHRNGRIIFANAYAVRMFGAQSLDELMGKSVLELVHPEERARAAERMKQLADRGGSVPLTEMRFLGPGGRTMPLEVQAVTFEDQGQPVVLAVGRDITERKASEERQALLMAELDHRVRNILASIQSMASLTARSATTKEEYTEKLQGRIAAMARVHELLTHRHWDGADVADIVRNGLQAHSEAVAVRGDPGHLLRARDALNLALVIHELATNAAKYGALSVPEGKVDVSWTGRADGDGERVYIVWRESGGPAVQPPTRRGFGSRLIQATLSSVALEFDPAGVQCRIKLKTRQIAGASEWRSHGVQQRADPTAPDEGCPLRGLRVLLVEDEVVTALELQSVLERAGAEVAAVATNLHEAMAMADRDIAAAVLDINLEGEMSYPVAESLLGRGVPIIFVTGYDAVQVLPGHLRNVPVLQKPIDGTALVRQLAQLAPTAG